MGTRILSPAPDRACVRLSLIAGASLLGLLVGCGSSTNSSGQSGGPATTPAGPTAGTSTPTASSTPPVPVESNPPGDIPDNLAFVRYTNRPGGYTFTHPEGWARTEGGSTVRFTDKLNGIMASSAPAAAVPTVGTARTVDVPRLRGSVPAFELRSVGAVSLPAGRGVRIVFRRNSDPDPVTGRVYRDEVEEYLVFAKGRLVRLDLFGPVGADNIDAYRTMSTSLRIQ
jgi:hypothetical protein